VTLKRGFFVDIEVMGKCDTSVSKV
jgi:hypothetical protein